MKKILFITCLLWFAVGGVMAQQDCGQTDCPGICGRFVDNNGDGFCDHGATSVSPKETATKDETGTKVQQKSANASERQTAESVQETQTETVEAAGQESSVQAEETVNDDEVTTETEQKKKSPYPVFTIMGILFGLYFVTFILAKTGKIKKVTHRKIWNIALAATCLVSCLLGVVLALFINYGYRPTYYIDFLHWHVYVGIAMTIIAIFHFLWHWGYYKAIFHQKKKIKKNR